MATYTNLTSLASLQVGDVVNYTSATNIDFGGKNVTIELYGIKRSSSNGGKTKFDFDTSKLSSKNYYFTPSNGGVCLCEGSSYNNYRRIAVAGDAGYGNNSSGTIKGCGGGLSGDSGYSRSYSYAGYSQTAGGGNGGTQASGGSGGTKSGSWIGSSGGNGSFGNAGSSTTSGRVTSYAGGNGWYGGGGGAAAAYSSSSSEGAKGGGGGGSGFVIGQSTTVYPSGYMGDSSSLIATIASAVSNATLTQGGSSESAGKMVITVLADPVPTLSSISIATYPTKTSYYTGETFSSTGLTIYANFSNGSQTTVSSGFTTSSPDMSTAGTKSVTVSYTVDGITKTTSFNITVTALTVTSISLSGNYPTVFTEGDAFSASGLVVTASYNNGSSAVISSGYSITSPNMSQVGTQTVTVSYSGKTASYTITINSASTPGIKYYDGTDFVPCDVYYCTGSGQNVEVEPTISTTNMTKYTGVHIDSYDLQVSSTGTITFTGDFQADKHYLFLIESDDEGDKPTVTTNNPTVTFADVWYPSDQYALNFWNNFKNVANWESASEYDDITIIDFITAEDLQSVTFTITTDAYADASVYDYMEQAGSPEFIKCEPYYYNGSEFVELEN